MIFDIYSPEEFFYSINIAWKKYKRDKQKSIEILLYVIMGLNHLREWIAPQYNPEYKCGHICWKTPTNDAERFSKTIYENASFEIIRRLCNKTKHLEKKGKVTTSSVHDLLIDDYSDVDAVRDWDRGPASAYFVDGINVINIVDEVLNFYQTEWFGKKGIIFK
jgi:hypothetical protein